MKTIYLILILCISGLVCSCGGTQPAVAVSPVDTDVNDIATESNSEKPMQQISPSNPMIKYTGRVDFSNADAPSFSFPGVSVSVRFTGTRLTVLLEDNAIRQDVDTTNYFNVVVDDDAPVLLKTLPAQKEYVLAENLGDGEHTVTLFKRSESSHGDDLNVGKVTIHGFILSPDATLLPPIARDLQMEFIGDSITCGYGNELAVDNPVDNHFTTLNSNAWNAFGAVAARQLNADYVAVAYSGRGVVRNYAGDASPTVPDIYLTTLPDDPDAAEWNPAKYRPDIVVINLGTNDFSEGLKPGKAIDALEHDFALRYETFMQELLGFYPAATFILTIGPMLSDGFPEKYKALTRVRRTLQKLVKNLNATGNANVYLLELTPQSAPFGEDFHPTVATHQRMADELMAFIKGI